MAVVELIESLADRTLNERDLFRWVTFWDIECLALALGLLWLSVRTFDGCFGRVAERPRRTPVLSDVIVVLCMALNGAILVGIGMLFGRRRSARA